MRIMQFPAPIRDLMDRGIDVETFSHMHVAEMVLCDDGAAISAEKEYNQFSPSLITRETGLLLTAKDVDTMLRGLKAVEKNAPIVGTSNLAIVTMRWKRPGFGSAMFGQAVEGVKQKLLWEGFNMLAWLVEFYQQTEIDFMQRKKNISAANKKLNNWFLKMGGGHKITFAQWRKMGNRNNRISHRCAMVLVCLGSSIRNGDAGSNFTVIRNIDTQMTPAQLHANVKRGFAGQGGGQGGDHKAYSGSGGGFPQHDKEHWDEI